MRKRERGLLLVTVAAVIALATLWALRETDVLRWGSGDDAALETVEAGVATPALARAIERIEGLQTRVQALEATLEGAEPGVAESDLVLARARVDDLQERIVALEAREPGVAAPALARALERIEDLQARVQTLETTLEGAEPGVAATDLVLVRAHVDDLQERIAAVEAREPGVAESDLTVAISQLEQRTLAREAGQAERIAALEEQPAQAGAVDPRIPALVTRIAALEDRITDLMQQVARIELSEAHFLVANTREVTGDPDQNTKSWWSEYCITYTVAGGLQERCQWIEREDHDDDGLWRLTDFSRPRWECFQSAVIGEPLPACWR